MVLLRELRQFFHANATGSTIFLKSGEKTLQYISSFRLLCWLVRSESSHYNSCPLLPHSLESWTKLSPRCSKLYTVYFHVYTRTSLSEFLDECRSTWMDPRGSFKRLFFTHNTTECSRINHNIASVALRLCSKRNEKTSVFFIPYCVFFSYVTTSVNGKKFQR